MGVMIDISTLEVTNEILSLVAEIDEFKGAWRAIGRIAPERLTSLRRVATIESIGSSTRIEGARLTDREVERLLSNIESKAFDADGKSLGTVFQTASPFETPSLMAELTDWTRAALEAREVHPLLVIAVFVVVFLAIHPFQDGNGRLSRILTTLLLLRAGYGYVQYASLESVIERTKDSYYLALRQTQGTIRTDRPDWHPWVVYFLRALRRHKDHLERKVERERIILGDLPELSVRILELARERGRITVGEAARATGTSRNTIKDHIRALADNGHLSRHGAGRGTWYSLA